MIVEVYPKVVLRDGTWTVIVKMRRADTGKSTRFVRTFPAVQVHTKELVENKLVFVIEVPDGVTPKQIARSLFEQRVGTVKIPGTLWESWQQRAEVHVAELRDTDDVGEYRKRWTKTETRGLRVGLRALAVKLGGRIVAVHHHEPDGSVTRG